MSNLETAIKLAVDAHQGQIDKNGQPYILHPLRVMLAQDDDTARVVAVLHDVVEDSDSVGHGDILAFFGAEVHDAVHALTRREGEAYADFVLRAKANPIASRVKIADIKDNLRPGAPHLRDRYVAALSVLEDSVDKEQERFDQTMRSKAPRQILASVRRMMPRNKKPNWSLAMDVFCVGSTYGHWICAEAGIDPDATTLTAFPSK